MHRIGQAMAHLRAGEACMAKPGHEDRDACQAVKVQTLPETLQCRLVTGPLLFSRGACPDGPEVSKATAIHHS